MNPTQTNKVPESLKRLLDASGAKTSFIRHIDHGTQYRVNRGQDAATLNVYRTGKISTGGKASSLREEIEGWRLSGASASGQKQSSPAEGSFELDATPRVGTDEAGKGDYFGPLVVAGVRVRGEEPVRKLREIGARDSKTLSVHGAKDLSQRVLESIGQENVRIVVLPPRKYEARRQAAGDINRLLAEVNVEIFKELEAEVKVFVVDEFARAARSYIEPRLSPGVRLVVRPRAEDDLAVAAASVLARARYLEEMEALSREVGFELPRGATRVIGAGRQVAEERGLEGLAEVAKVHFGTTARVLGAPEKVRE